MAFLGGLELFLAKPMLGLFAKIGITGKVAVALSAGTAVGVSAFAIKKGVEWANRTYNVKLKEEWILLGKEAIDIAFSSKSFTEALDKIGDSLNIQTASALIAKFGSSAFDAEISRTVGEASIASIIHAIGDEKKLGLAT